MDLTPHHATVHYRPRTAPDPRVRHRADGRDGLADRGRRGCPPTLNAAARDLLETVLTASPLDHGYPVTIWTVADLTDLRGRPMPRTSP